MVGPAERLARARLDEERWVTDQRRADLAATFRALTESSVDANADDEHDPEGATIAFERAQLSATARPVARTCVGCP